MDYNTKEESKNPITTLQVILPCKCCSLSANEIQKGGGVNRGTMNLKYLKCKKILNAIKRRHINLINRRQRLTEKLSTIEKTMPVLMGYNTSMSIGKNSNIDVDRIKDIVNESSPYSRQDPIEKLIEEIKNHVSSLNIETNKLHGKIIEADMKLEESTMVLESLQVMNNELNDKLKVIESNSKYNMGLIDFQSFDRDDLNCLAKIRQLVQQKIQLKCCINALKDRENHIRTQLNCILSANEQKNQLKLKLRSFNHTDKKHIENS